jgi:Putative adhesin
VSSGLLARRAAVVKRSSTTRSFETPGEPRLRIRTPSGLVSVETADTEETTVELQPLRGDDVTRTAIEQATVEQRGNEIVVETAKQGWGFLGRSPSVGIRIRCPYGSVLDCTTASADVEAAGRLGEAIVKSASGDIALPHVAGSVSVHSASGDVRVEVVDGDANLKTVSGDVRVGVARSELSVTLVSGDFEVGEAHTDLSANTVSGDQHVRSIRGGEIRLQSVSGDIQVGVAPGTRVFIDASATSGDVSSALDVTDAPVGSSAAGGEAKLRLKSVSGDISIVRGARPAEVA